MSRLPIDRRYLSIILLAAAFAYSMWGIRMADIREDEPENVGREIEVLIVPGQNAAEVAAEFERLGIVKRAKDLVIWMGRLGIDRRIRPGIYRITSGRAGDVAKELARSRPDVQNVRILPGAIFSEIASALERKDGDLLLAEALENEENFPAGMKGFLGEKVEGRVVFLAPETYSVNPGEAAVDELVRLASRTWWKRHKAYLPEGITAKELEMDGILASIVQKEALLDSERPMISGVFKNRLRQDMPLQSCATIIHAWRLRGVKKTSVSYEDVKIDSPFNSYIHKGLPPENIGVPSESSWNAVLKPENTDMLFFVAKGDGSHVFTKTYREHLNAQKKIRAGQL